MTLEYKNGVAILRFATPEAAQEASLILKNWSQTKTALLASRSAMSDLKQREWSTGETEAALSQVRIALAMAGEAA